MPVESSVKDFLGRFKGGFARPNRYLVEFKLPVGINESGSWINSNSTRGNLQAFERRYSDGVMSFSCHTCNMPARTLMVYEHSQHSAPFKVPISQQYEPVTFAFHSSPDMIQRKFFETWQTTVININDNSLNYFVEYISDVKITQLDRAGEPRYSVTLYGAWPISVGDVEYGASNNDSVTNISVTLAFKVWKADHDDTSIYVYSAGSKQ